MSRRVVPAIAAAPLAAALGEAVPPPTFSADADFCVAVMLLGSVAFDMMLFYWLNYSDDSIRAAAWSVLSTSICTFTGVLIGMSWNQSFVYFILGPPEVAGPVKTILGNLLASIGWYILLQVVLMVVSGAVGLRPNSIVTIVLNLKCFGMLLGITTGASSLTMWGLIQTLAPHNLAATVGVLVSCVCTTGFMYRTGAWVRHFVAHGDGVVDEYERLWDYFVQETEDAALALSLSYLLVQSTCQTLMGWMPLKTGQAPPGVTPTRGDVLGLLVCGLGYVLLIPVLDLCVSHPKWPRPKSCAKMVVGKAGAFCLLFSMTWAVADILDSTAPPAQTVLALGTTFLGMVIILVLEYLKDLECTGRKFDQEAKALIGPVAVLIGFGWKQAFVGSLTTITAKVRVMPIPFQTTCMAAVMVAVVVPAWRLHILPKVMKEVVERAEREMACQNESAPSTSRLGAPLLHEKAEHSDEEEEGEDWNPNKLVIESFARERRNAVVPNEVVRQNIVLQHRVAELEDDIRDICAELSELREIAAVLA